MWHATWRCRVQFAASNGSNWRVQRPVGRWYGLPLWISLAILLPVGHLRCQCRQLYHSGLLQSWCCHSCLISTSKPWAYQWMSWRLSDCFVQLVIRYIQWGRWAAGREHLLALKRNHKPNHKHEIVHVVQVTAWYWGTTLLNHNQATVNIAYFLK